MASRYVFSGPLWATPGEVFWVFVTLPRDVSDRIRAVPRPPRPGFGSLRVNATIGTSTWQTSIFPDAKTGSYLLPVKKGVRMAQKIDVADTVDVTIELRE